MREPITPLRHVLFWSIALGGAAFDLITKTLVFAVIGEPGTPPHPIWDKILEIRTSFNPGALWGLGKNWPHSSLMFAILSVIAGAAIFYWLFVRGAAADRRLTAALGLIMAGAIGNCFDRFTLGHVRDFVHFHVDSIGFDFPIFNFADNMLVIGAAILVVLAMAPDHSAHPAPEATPPA
jgi:signal peptidase II